ncbi:TonB-dependent receptor, partial [Litorivivens sp.]|uniref:TonB-dependent receptor n=1 Tax=Litorivivens sp. TaxID=2020868 RepID=UPI00356149AD
MRKHLPLAAAIAAISASYTSPGIAQNQQAVLEEVVVTARKRSETLQDVPFSIAAMTESRMRNSGATNLETMAANIAGVTIQNLGPGQSQVAIRGVSAGQIVRDQPGVKEQVGVYFDESVISLSLFTPDLDFYDTNRVEVLRGPQGTLFGSGSLSGTIRYISNEPQFDASSGSLEIGGNSINEGSEGWSIKGHINAPVSDKFAVRAVAYEEHFGGYIDALQPNRATNQPNGETKEDVNDGKRRGFRFAINYQPTEALSIQPRIVWQEVDMNGFNREDTFNILANPYTTSRVAVRLDELEQFTQLEEKFVDNFRMTDLEVNYSFNEMIFTSVTSFTDREILVRRDATALTGSVTGDSFGESEAVYTLDAPLNDTTDVEMWTQEFRLGSDNEDAFQWVIGAFYSDVKRHYAQSLIVKGYEDNKTSSFNRLPNDPAGKDELYYSDIPYELKQTAVFGEASYDVTDRLNLTLGARWYDYEEERVFTSSGIFAHLGSASNASWNIPGATEANGISPRLLARYDVNDEVMLNAQVSKGFRLGGISDPLNAGLCGSDLARFSPFAGEFDDETVINYEVGTKVTLNNGKGTFNTAVFYNDIENLQATIDAGNCSSRVIASVDEAHTAGIEIELTMRPSANFEYGFSGSFTESKLDSDVRDPNGVIL